MRVVMFGTERHAHIWGLRSNIPRKNIVLATSPNAKDFIRGEKVLTVVVVPKEHWRPPTFACEQRVKETEQLLKHRKESGVIINTENMT